MANACDETSWSTKLKGVHGAAAMRRVNMHEAKTHLSRLVNEAAAGASYVICMAGRPLVRATPLEGLCAVPDDFDQLAAQEIADLFDGIGPL